MSDEQQDTSSGFTNFVRYLLAALAIFDIALGVVALGFQGVYLDLLHPAFDTLHPNGPTYWLSRTGVIWLFFAATEAVAAWEPDRRVWLVGLVGILRLMDVPADLVYFFAADDLGLLGMAGLLFSPAFNLTAGLYLVTRPSVRELVGGTYR